MPKHEPMAMGRRRRTPYVDPFLERKPFRPKPVPLPDGGTRLPTKEELVEQYLDARIGFAADLAGDPPAKRRFQDRTGALFEHAYGGLPLKRGFSGRREAQPPARADFAGLDFEDDPLPPPEELLAPPRPPSPPARAPGPEHRGESDSGPPLQKPPGEPQPFRQPGGSLLARAPGGSLLAEAPEEPQVAQMPLSEDPDRGFRTVPAGQTAAQQGIRPSIPTTETQVAQTPPAQNTAPRSTTYDVLHLRNPDLRTIQRPADKDQFIDEDDWTDFIDALERYDVQAVTNTAVSAPTASERSSPSSAAREGRALTEPRLRA